MRRRASWVSIGVALVAGWLLCLQAHAQNREWTWYKNKAFDNAIEVPKDLFIKTSSTPDQWAELSAISKEGFELVINAKRDPGLSVKQVADRMISKFGLAPTQFTQANTGNRYGMNYALYSYQGQFKGKKSWAVLMAGINGANRYALMLYTPLDTYAANKAVMQRIANSIRPLGAAPK